MRITQFCNRKVRDFAMALRARKVSEAIEKRAPGVICGLSLLLVLYPAPRGFSPGTPVFPTPQKSTIPNSNSILECTCTDISERVLQLLGALWINKLRYFTFTLDRLCLVFCNQIANSCLPSLNPKVTLRMAQLSHFPL